MVQDTRLDRCRCIKVEPARPEVGCTNGPGLWDQLLPNLLLAGRRCPRSAFRKRVAERGATSHVHPHALISWCKSTCLDGWCHVHLPSTPSSRWPGPASSSTPIERTTPLTTKISRFLPHLFRMPSRNLRPAFSSPRFFLHVLSGSSVVSQAHRLRIATFAAAFAEERSFCGAEKRTGSKEGGRKERGRPLREDPHRFARRRRTGGPARDLDVADECTFACAFAARRIGIWKRE